MTFSQSSTKKLMKSKIFVFKLQFCIQIVMIRGENIIPNVYDASKK
jgi:hypothetical protein